jgi:pyruvate dehydrogenase complex dehydrogenase (E1) component
VPGRATACSAPTASAVPITRKKLRSFFEVDRYYIVVAALKALADDDPEKPNPATV